MRAVNRREKQIATLLEGCGSSVARTGFGRWDFALANGKSISATARLLEEWLVLDAPVCDRVARADFWRLLQLNAALDGGSKFVLMPEGRSVHVRADIALLDDEDPDSDSEWDLGNALEDRVHDACAGLKAAFGSFQGKSASRQSRLEPAEGSNDQNESPAETIQRRCLDTGWQFVERSAGTLVVDLNAEGGFYQAVIERLIDGAYVSAEIARWDALAESSRQALGLLLLKAGALLRLVRPAVEEQEDQIGARFEVRFTSVPSAAELDHAFSFLSVACTLCGREARAVQDEVIAREYLARGGHAAENAVVSEAMLAAAD